MRVKNYPISLTVLVGLLVGAIAFGGRVQPARAAVGIDFKETRQHDLKSSAASRWNGLTKHATDLKKNLLRNTVYNHRILKKLLLKDLKPLSREQEQELVAEAGNERVADIVTEANIKQNFAGKLPRRLLKLVAGGSLGLLTISQLVQQAHADSGGFNPGDGGPGTVMLGIGMFLAFTYAILHLYRGKGG